MSGYRSGARRLSLVAAVTALYVLLIRPRILTWGASRDEARRAYPADELIPDAKGPTNWFTVMVLGPNRTLVLQSRYGLTGRPFDPRTDPVPRAYVEGSLR